MKFGEGLGLNEKWLEIIRADIRVCKWENREKYVNFERCRRQ